MEFDGIIQSGISYIVDSMVSGDSLNLSYLLQNCAKQKLYWPQYIIELKYIEYHHWTSSGGMAYYDNQSMPINEQQLSIMHFGGEH